MNEQSDLYSKVLEFNSEVLYRMAILQKEFHKKDDTRHHEIYKILYFLLERIEEVSKEEDPLKCLTPSSNGQ